MILQVQFGFLYNLHLFHMVLMTLLLLVLVTNTLMVKKVWGLIIHERKK